MKRTPARQMSTRRQHRPSLGSRQGEGVPLELAKQGESTLLINISDARVPDRRYPADVVDVRIGSDQIRMLFGQANVVGEGLHSLLVIHVSFIGALQFLMSMKAVAESAEAFFGKNRIPGVELHQVQHQPTQTVGLAANMIAASFSGREACMDFYHVSAFAMLDVARAEKIHAEPVVRITLTSQLMVAIYRKLLEHSSRIPKDEMEKFE